MSTTHSLASAIVGTSVAAAGLQGVEWTLVLSSVAVPLALSPILACGATYLVHTAARAACRRPPDTASASLGDP